MSRHRPAARRPSTRSRRRRCPECDRVQTTVRGLLVSHYRNYETREECPGSHR